jgi:N-acyl-D-glutamate deacylase
MKRVLNKIILVSIFFMVLPVCATEYDLVIENGRVLDPQTKLDAIMNIGITDGKIQSVSKEPMQGVRVVDASGLVVAPGFIDMHAHGQSILSNRVQAFDGVTTALELESGTFPVSEFYAIREKEGRPLNYGASVNWASARIQVMIGEAPSSESDWFSSMFNKSGWQNTVATESQTQAIIDIVKQGLEQGGLGVGFLTGYAPGSGRKEYQLVSALAAKVKVPTFTHARFLSMIEPGSSFDGIQEIIATSAITGVQAHTAIKLPLLEVPRHTSVRC